MNNFYILLVRNHHEELFITRPISEISNEEDEEEMLSHPDTSSPPPSPTMSTSFMSNENSELQSSCQQQHPSDLDHGDVTVDGIIEEMVEWNSRQQAAMLECSSYEDETRPRPKTRQDNPRR